MIYFRKIIVAAAFVLAAATSTSAAIVDFEDVTADGSATANPFDSGGLTFSLGFLWDHNSPNSNGSTNLIFTDFGTSGVVTITRTGGGRFSLIGLDMATSYYSTVSPNSVLVNGNILGINSTLTTYVLNLIDVSSVTISGLFDDTGIDHGNAAFGYWTVDNITYRPSAVVPLPAALPLLLIGLGALGAVARRRKTA